MTLEALSFCDLAQPIFAASDRVFASETTNTTGGSDEGVLQTMRRITKEGDGGLANLFAGWFERALYLGLGRAWYVIENLAVYSLESARMLCLS